MRDIVLRIAAQRTESLKEDSVPTEKNTSRERRKKRTPAKSSCHRAEEKWIADLNSAGRILFRLEGLLGQEKQDLRRIE